MAESKTKNTKKTVEKDELDKTAVENRGGTTKDPLDNYLLDARYREQQAQLDTAKRNAEQSASVSYELLKKYLPIQNQMNGLSGLGVSESAAIEANNNYMAQLGQIGQTHAADSAALLENYRAEQAAEQDEAYNEAYALITSGTYNSFEDLDHYLANVKDDVSHAQYDRLYSLAEYAKGNPEEQARMAAIKQKKLVADGRTTNAWFNDIKHGSLDKKGNNFWITINGEAVGVESGGIVTDPKIVDAGKKYLYDAVFKYDGNYYLNKEGRIYRIQKRQMQTNNQYNEMMKRIKD